MKSVALAVAWHAFVAAGFGATLSDADLRTQAVETLRRGAEFFRSRVAVQGTYLWQYADDLSEREGETKATSSQGWVQPPGTPAVGMAWLSAWQATGNSYYLDAARETAAGLIGGQLRSGGWTYSITFDPAERKKFAYRWDGGAENARNVTTLDDDTTQAALRFLMRLDEALGFRDGSIHEAVEYATASLLKAQYPNGSWPQGFDQFPVPEKFPVTRANYPETWLRSWPGGGQYWTRYTLNDNSLATTIETMFEAARIYGGGSESSRRLARQCRAAAEKAGDFILLAQMPEPQPAWAQQYDFEMHPAWARKFEPPAVTGGESQGVLRTLLDLYRATGKEKYLEPVPRALAYLRRSRLPDGRLARFYELRSNKPLYFTRNYVLTNDDRDLPTHYAFKVKDQTDDIARQYEQLRSAPPGRSKVADVRPVAGKELLDEVKAVVAAQDAEGRWVEPARLRSTSGTSASGKIIRCVTFNRNVETLSRYLAATRP